LQNSDSKIAATASTKIAHNWAQTAADILARVRERSPRVHCITNEVAVSYSANALLAVGAIPSMTWQENEVTDFVESANSLVVNLGTLDEGRQAGMNRAIATANERELPWVLDPVFIERSPNRLQLAHELLNKRPAIVRGNAAEHAALGDVDSLVKVTSGASDRVQSGEQVITLHNGHAMMAQVTATGCAATALLGACVSVSDNPCDGAVAATLVLGIAGEIAAGLASGPGSLQITLLDALSNLTPEQIHSLARYS